ncbi:anti-sigma factor family protein [Acidicapsa dinghuensis]|uniref:Anti-sigma factor family protein n=1 Tax=Acidicapsa dinghuensis TaxID=2218256 RepID=A0ABW1ECF5_9BACT|nr:anti-sigma factor [Acidicapsa dinghuensis]
MTETARAAYVDGESSGPDAAAFELHLATCPVCAAQVALLLRMKREMRAARGRYAAPAALRSTIRRQIAADTGKPARWLWPVLATACLVVLAAVLTVGFEPRQGVWNEVADLHASALASTNPYDVVSSDRHTVKPWFQGKIPFSFNIPELGGTGYALLGGRMVYLKQEPAAQLIVGMGQHRISVLIVRAGVGADPAMFGGGHTGFHTESWREGELRFYVVGDAEEDAIRRLAELIRKANS